MKLSTILFISLLSTATLFAQPDQPPAVELWRVYDFGLLCNDQFLDIYATADDGYIMCGYSYNSENNTVSIIVVRIDEDYQDIWARQYNFGRNRNFAFSVIETDDGDFLLGGHSGSGPSVEFFAMLVEEDDGDIIWNHQYIHEESGGRCEAVLELKDGGNFVLAGTADHSQWQSYDGYVICIDPDGDVLWEFEYPTTHFYTMRETNGGIVLAGIYYDRDPSCSIIIKIDFNGELLWDEFPDIGAMEDRGDYAVSMVSSPEGGFAVAGNCYINFEDAPDRVPYLLKIDGDGQREWVRHYDIEHPENMVACGLAKMTNGSGYILTGWKTVTINNLPTPIMQAIRINNRGILRWRSLLPEGEILNLPGFSAGFNSVVVDASNSMLTVGTYEEDDGLNNRRNNQVAVLVKLEPDEVPAPYIIFLPEDSQLSALPGDSITFSAEPVNFEGERITYLWALDEDTLAHDDRTDSMIVVFPDYGEYEMYGAVFAEDDLVGEKTWHVSVVEWFISGFTPDSLDFTIRRGREVDFSLDVTAIEGIDLNYNWAHIDRNNHWEDIGDSDSQSVLFDLTGHQQIIGNASVDNNVEEILWHIDVRSSVWYWWPHELEISVPMDTILEFTVFPFNPDSDSLRYLWEVDGDSLDSCRITEVNFPEDGLHEVTVYAWDGAEVDTIRWTINVIHPDWVGYTDDALLPDQVILYPAVPNPFNAVTMVNYSLPLGMDIDFAIFDLSGRRVMTLERGFHESGYHTTRIGGENLPAGVYFLRLSANGMSLMQKAVLIK